MLGNCFQSPLQACLNVFLFLNAIFKVESQPPSRATSVDPAPQVPLAAAENLFRLRVICADVQPSPALEGLCRTFAHTRFLRFDSDGLGDSYPALR